MKKQKIAIIAIALAAIIGLALLLVPNRHSNTDEQPQEALAQTDTIPAKPIVTKYGLPIEDFIVTYDTIKPKETLAEVLFGFGFSAQQIHDLTQCPDSIFDERKIRPGQACAMLYNPDSTRRYFVYETSPKSYVTFDSQHRGERARLRGE